jgi:hypothetical protein
MTVEVNTAVTPSLHPHVVEKIPGYDDQTGPYVGEVKRAFQTAYAAIASVHKAREAAAKDPTLNEAGQILKVAAFAENQQQAATRACDSAYANLTKAINATEGMLNTPLEQAAGQGTVPEEIRRHVKGMSQETRLEFMNAAIERVDIKTLSSILGAPFYLSGLTPDAQSHFTRMYHERKTPDVAARLRVMKEAHRMLVERGPLLFSEIEKGIGASWRKVKRLQDAVSESQKSFIVGQDS